jgi:hypothetical protein
MSGRRAHQRFAFVPGVSGSIHLRRPVVIISERDGEITAVATSPAVVDEEMSLDLSSRHDNATIRVRVIGSRACVIDGAVRHEIRVRVIEQSNG